MLNVRRIFVLAMISIGLLSSSGAFAKYGLINMQDIILGVQEGKDARSALEKEIKAKEAEFTKRREELDKLNKDWSGQAALMSEEARMNKQKEFQEKFLSLRNDEQGFREDVKRKEQKVTQGIAVKVETMVQKIAKDKGIEVVFEVNSAGLLYLKDPIDLTKEVIDKYGKSGSGK